MAPDADQGNDKDPNDEQNRRDADAQDSFEYLLVQLSDDRIRYVRYRRCSGLFRIRCRIFPGRVSRRKTVNGFHVPAAAQCRSQVPTRCHQSLGKVRELDGGATGRVRC